MRFNIKISIILSLFLITLQANAGWHPSRVSMTKLQKKIEIISQSFLGMPYILDALGEGKNATYDQDPLYRFDGLDCTTFVETVTAIALSMDRKDTNHLIEVAQNPDLMIPLELYYDHSKFLETLTRIRYKRGRIGFTKRNHFPEIDWLPNNIRAGFYRDITRRVAPKGSVRIAHATIDKRSWYESLSLDQIRDDSMDAEERARRLEKLHAEGRHYKPRRSRLPYIPFETVLKIMDKIPSGSIVNMIAPDWIIKDKDGNPITELSVAHQGFIIQKDGHTYIRSETTRHGRKAQDELFEDYIHYYQNQENPSKPMKGINLMQALPQR